MTREFDPVALLDGNIDSVTATFGDHDDAQLGKLLEAEKAGKSRTGLVEAIEREQATRKSDADAKPKDGADAKAKEGSGEKTFSQAEVDALIGEHQTALAKAREEDKAAIDNLTSELAATRKELSSKAARPPKAVKSAEPRKLALMGKSSGEGLRVAFGDDRDMSIPTLPELEFGGHDFAPVPGGGTTLDRVIDFPEGSPSASISAAWLVDGKGEAHAVSRLVQPLRVGGGSSAQIPAKFLNFTGGKVAVATEARLS